MKRKLICLTGVLSAALLLTACGTAATPSESATPASAAPETPTVTEAPATPAPSAAPSYVYGTATLTFAEFYAGDVSSTDSYDAVSSATTSKYNIMSNIASDFVDETTNAGGYHITGVQNVNVAVAETELEAYRALNPTFVPSEETPEQYKTVTVENGKAVYSATVFRVAETVENAVAELETGSVWGDYQINVTDPEGVSILRNTREDEGFAVNSNIQGIILETSDGLRVGMEYLQSIWVQPYEVSWNVSADNSHNVHIAGWDNLPELDKLVGKTITKITYIMPDGAYVYTFDGIYVKPIYDGDAAIGATFTEGSSLVRVEGIPEELENPTVTVIMGSGRNKVTLADAAALTDGAVTMRDADGNETAYDPEQVYTVTVNSDNYAGLSAAIPMSGAERAQLAALISKAEEVLAEHEDAGVAEHMEEAAALLAAEAPTSGDAQELISELTSHLSVYEAPAEDAQEGHGGGETNGHSGESGGHEGGGRPA